MITVSTKKKPRVYYAEWNEALKKRIFTLVGMLSVCRCVSKEFLPKSCITAMRFDPQTPINMMMHLLAVRENIVCIDFTGSVVMTESVLRVVVMLQPKAVYLILDRCPGMTSFPELEDRPQCKNTTVTRSGVLKWFHDRERHVSLKGCWRLFSPEHVQGPLSLTILLKSAVYSGTTESDARIRSFCMDPTEVERNIHPTI